MSKRVIRSLTEGRLQPPLKGKKRAQKPIGFDRVGSYRSSRLDLFKPRSANKTRSLIKYLLGHGTRAQRATLPRKQTRLRVKGPNGSPAVKLNFY